ncbi:MAG: CHASE2 domain-containing protein, partial [Pseudomonadota bacterium]
MITGQFTSRQKRYLQGMVATLLVLVVFLFLLLGGRLSFIEHRGLDLLHRIRLLLSDQSKVSSEIVLVYIDQKSIDSFRRNLDVGWPWPRDFYARAVQYLSQAGARAIVFDATYSEPSVFANTVPDDETFAKASAENGRVFQTLMFHRELKDKDAPINQEALTRLLKRGLPYQHQGGPLLPVFEDVTMPILPLEESAWGLGVISIDPEPDGVVRRLRPLFAFRDHYYSTLSLAVYLKLNRINQVIQTQEGLDLGGLRVPLDKEGKALLSFYGRSGAYPEFNFASVIQSAAQLEA